MVILKGYYVPSGYMGLVGDKYILFASESDYVEYVTERQRRDCEAVRNVSKETVKQQGIRMSKRFAKFSSSVIGGEEYELD